MAERPDLARILGLRHAEGRTRLALALPGPVPFRVDALDAPPRLVVDFPAAAWAGEVPPPPPDGIVKGLRAGLSRDGRARLVIDLKAPARLAEAVQFETEDGARLRLILAPDAAEDFSAHAGWPAGELPLLPGLGDRDPRPLVMLDPGHGGMDPGAIRGDAVEKNLVLTFAKDLARALEESGRWRVEMTREDDRYLGLAERVELAEAEGASALISLHANTVARGDAVGASVFTLSAGPSDAETEALATSENNADIRAGRGARVEAEPDAVARAIHQISMRGALRASRALGQGLAGALSRATPMLSGRGHSQAGFRVLRSPLIPAALVELGFLSNPDDLARLRDPAWRARTAQAMVEGLDAWAAQAAAQPYAGAPIPGGDPT